MCASIILYGSVYTYTYARHKHVHGSVLEVQAARQDEEEGCHQKDEHMIYAIQYALYLQPGGSGRGQGFHLIRHVKSFFTYFFRTHNQVNQLARVLRSVVAQVKLNTKLKTASAVLIKENSMR